MKRILLLLVVISSLCGCSFKGELTKTDAGFKWEANGPCKIKMGDIEVDGKREPLFKLDIPLLKGGA